MIKLRQLLPELERYDDDAPDMDVIDQFGEYTYGLLPNDVKKYIRKIVKNSGIDDWDMDADPLSSLMIPIKGPIIDWIKSKSIWSAGSMEVVKISKWSVYNLYYLFDISKKYLEDSVLGIIKTTNTEQKYSSVKLGSFYSLKGEEVHWSNVAKQGKGYGSMLYDAVLDSAGVLFSDNTLFQGSQAMWKYHMSKKAFFGCIINFRSIFDSNARYIIPINQQDIEGDWLDEVVERFVVVKDRSMLPKIVRRLEYNTKGLHPVKDIVFVSFNESFVFKKKYKIAGESTSNGYTFEDYIENFDSISDWISAPFEADNLSNMTDTQKFTDAKVNVMEIPGQSNGDFKLAIVKCNDVVVLLKNSGSGISVQILD